MTNPNITESGATRGLIAGVFVDADGNKNPVHVRVAEDGGLVISGATITGPVTVSNEVEVKNDTGNPIPVSASVRNCVGRQTISVTTGAVSTLTVPGGAVAATIQADGAAISLTLDGSTNPTATVGMRLDDGVFFNVDSALASVKMIARTTTVNVQVAYFDKA